MNLFKIKQVFTVSAFLYPYLLFCSKQTAFLSRSIIFQQQYRESFFSGGMESYITIETVIFITPIEP